jgi:predicted acylesterase/phospholipase RssA
MNMIQSLDNASTGRDETKSICRILSLDGGGAKGFYTLGVLKEVEAMLGVPLHERFDLIFGTSTGAIIGCLMALGYRVDEIHALYKEYVPAVMRQRNAAAKTSSLRQLTSAIFKDSTFETTKTGIGVVTTRWLTERPMIFKASVQEAHGRKGTFVPGFGVTIADAVEASCSAYPFFERKRITTQSGDVVELIDGGYCANNPTLYAIADATAGLKRELKNLRVLNVGVGVYPEPKPPLSRRLAKKYLVSVQLLQKTLEINTQSMDQLRMILFNGVRTIRVSDTFEQPEMATDFMEHNLDKLNILWQRGRDSFALREKEITELLT